ncbi:MAG TPA: serine hydrolase domain-containing protein [Croceibacterium sp.]|nr:serine hydrolase domain-containing protein [Croceibacterium sp.]
MITKCLAAALLVTATAGAAAAAAPAAAQPADLAVEAEAILTAAYGADGPGAAAIVTRGGQVLYSGGRGLADLETGRAITPATVFRTGSITKQFVAATVLTLVAEGRLSLDDPLAKFFPDWPAPGAGATVRQLLNHSSGIFDYTKIPGYMLSEPTLRPNTTADLLAVIRSQPSRAAPGAAWEYNNGGYVILAAIVEQLTGRPWHAAVIERIARPLGLTTLRYAVDAEGEPATARFYGAEDGRPVPARGVHMSVAHGAGGLVASVEDMARWAQALHHGEVVGPELYHEMTSRAQLSDGSSRPYGFGLRLLQVRGRPALVHGGAGRGVDTGSVYIPADDVFVAVFANSDELATDASMVVQRLAALAVGQPIPSFTPAAVPMAEIEPLLGAYQVDGGPRLSFFARDGKLYFGDGDDERPVLAAGGDRFFFADGGLMWLAIERDEGGAHVMKLDPPDEAQPIRAVRSGPVPAPFTVVPEVLQSYLGSYATEGPVLIVGRGANGWLTIAPAGDEPIALRPVSDTEFRADTGGFRVVFHPEGGRAERLTLHRGARELHGKRTGG